MYAIRSYYDRDLDDALAAFAEDETGAIIVLENAPCIFDVQIFDHDVTHDRIEITRVAFFVIEINDDRIAYLSYVFAPGSRNPGHAGTPSHGISWWVYWWLGHRDRNNFV